jgi:hypothetical protein
VDGAAERPIAGGMDVDEDGDSVVTLGELHRRLTELETARTLRVASVALVASALALLASLFALVVAF